MCGGGACCYLPIFSLYVTSLPSLAAVDQALPLPLKCFQAGYLFHYLPSLSISSPCFPGSVSRGRQESRQGKLTLQVRTGPQFFTHLYVSGICAHEDGIGNHEREDIEKKRNKEKKMPCYVSVRFYG